MSNKIKKITLFVIFSLVFLACFLMFAHQVKAAIAIPAPVQASNPTLAQILQNPEIKKAWSTVLSLINYVIIIALIVIAFANILRIQIETYAIKKILPTLIIAVILANFSFLICTMILGFSSALFKTIVDFGTGGAGNYLSAVYNTTFPGVTQAFASGISIIASGGIALLVTGVVWTSVLGGLLVGLLLFIFPSLIFIIIWFLLIIRKFVIIVLVAISPLAFFSVGLPMTSQYFKMWWDVFLKWVFMPAAAFFIISIAMKIAPSIGSTSGVWSKAIQFAFMTGALILAVIVPFKLGGGIMAAWGGLGRLGGRILGKAPRTAGSLAESFGKVRTEKLRAAGRLRPDQISGLEKAGAFVRKYGSYADVGTYTKAGSKVWETMEEERRLEAEREIFGAPGIRKFIASDAAVSAAYRRRTKYREMSEPQILAELNRKRKDENLRNFNDDNLSKIKNGANWVDINAAIAELAFRENMLRQRGRAAPADDILAGLQALGLTKAASHELLQEFKPVPFGGATTQKGVAATSAKGAATAQKVTPTAYPRGAATVVSGGTPEGGLISLADTQQLAAIETLGRGEKLGEAEKTLIPSIQSHLDKQETDLDAKLKSDIDITFGNVNIDKNKIIESIKGKHEWDEVKESVKEMIERSTLPTDVDKKNLANKFNTEFENLHDQIQKNIKVTNNLNLEAATPVYFSLDPVMKQNPTNLADFKNKLGAQRDKLKTAMEHLEGKGVSPESIELTKNYLIKENLGHVDIKDFAPDRLKERIKHMQTGTDILTNIADIESRKGTDMDTVKKKMQDISTQHKG